MPPEYEVVDRTRGWRQCSRDLALILAYHLLWLSWGHVVTLTRLSDAAPELASPSLPSPRD